MSSNVLVIDGLTSVLQYLGEVLRLNSSWYVVGSYPGLWYRGVKSAAFDLVPGAYFRKNCDELSLVLYFRSMSPSLLPREPLDDWEWYYLMQHYGIPTRLLDWTESPLAALYFALEEDADGCSPCVWVMNPFSLNRLSDLPEHVLCPYPGRDLDYWLPDNCNDRCSVHVFGADERFKDNTNPLAIYPKRYNPRIVAQRGVFTVHGMDKSPINHLPILDDTGTEPRIAQIVFDGASRPRLRDELWALGFTKTTSYPEAPSLAHDLKRSFSVS